MKWRGAVALLLLMATGCAERKVKTWAPVGCIAVKAFNKPCRQISDSLYRCDEVIIRVGCVRYGQGTKQ